tara:strand:+ start:471 stop:833 length:363 start_codon:yes stop_codon:yes gene_type:complete
MQTNKGLIALVVILGFIIVVGFIVLAIGIMFKFQNSDQTLSNNPDHRVINRAPIQKNPNERVILKVPSGSKVTSTNANKSEIIINFINNAGNKEVFVFSRDNGSLLNKYLIKERRNDFKD